MSYALADILFVEGAPSGIAGSTDRILSINGENKKVAIVGEWSVIPEKRKDGKMVLEFAPDEESLRAYKRYGLGQKITIIDSPHLIQESQNMRLTRMGEAQYYVRQKKEQEG